MHHEPYNLTCALGTIRALLMYRYMCLCFALCKNVRYFEELLIIWCVDSATYCAC